jgi:hypothetical protein
LPQSRPPQRSSTVLRDFACRGEADERLYNPLLHSWAEPPLRRWPNHGVQAQGKPETLELGEIP